MLHRPNRQKKGYERSQVPELNKIFSNGSNKAKQCKQITLMHAFGHMQAVGVKLAVLKNFKASNTRILTFKAI